jgi:serine/threonine protein kinase
MKTEVSFKTAVYQIGLVMHGLLAGRLPTITNDGGNMNVVINEKSMKRYPEKLVALVSSMCALNPADRPSPQEVFRELSAIKRDHPELNEILAEAELEDSQPEIQDTAPFQNSSSKERAINE